MTKADLVDLIYERVGSPKKEAGEVVEAVFAIIRESLRHGSKVKISGFGTFIVNHKRARRGTIREAARIVRKREIDGLPVVEEGRLAGIITTTDVLEATTSDS